VVKAKLAESVTHFRMLQLILGAQAIRCPPAAAPRLQAFEYMLDHLGGAGPAMEPTRGAIGGSQRQSYFHNRE